MATRARWSPATDSNIASHRARNSATAKTWVNVARARACLAWVPGARPAMDGGEGAPARAAGVLRTAAGCAARFPTPPPFGCYSCACPILGMAGPEHQPKVFKASLTGDIIIGQPPAGACGLCPGGGSGARGGTAGPLRRGRDQPAPPAQEDEAEPRLRILSIAAPTPPSVLMIRRITMTRAGMAHTSPHTHRMAAPIC